MTLSQLSPAIGLQLYTLRELMQQDLPGTLAAVAAMGYKTVEFAGYFKHPPAHISELLDQQGLSAPSAHVAPHRLLHRPELALDEAAEAGHKYLVLAWWEETLRTENGYYQLADLLNHVGQLAQTRGLKLAYHNHDFEFSALSNFTPYDFLLAQTNPDYVCYELDLYWAVHAGRNPMDLLVEHPGRFALLHAKDMDSSGAETDIGNGQIDFAKLLGHLPLDAVQYLFVERDEPEAALASAALGLSRLNEILNP